jgi:DNA-binding response OmpR family regulator
MYHRNTMRYVYNYVCCKHMYSILVVEENISLANKTAMLLERKSMLVTVCHMLESAFIKIKNQSYDLVITSQHLPDGDGLEIVEYLRRYSFPTRSMVISKTQSLPNRVRSYKLGADDFIGKPFDVIEFWLRVNILLFRRKILERSTLTLGDQIKLYPEEGLLSIDGKNSLMRRKEAEVLSCLMSHPDRVVSREEITRWVWRDAVTVPKKITLEVYIKRIRIQLGDYSSYLETVRGFGYRIRRNKLRDIPNL